MSTPLRATENTDDPSLYIPKRAREGLIDPGSPANHSDGDRSEQIQREQSLRRIEEQLGALKKALIIDNFEVPPSLVPPSLDPSPVPQPPVLRSRRRRAVRMALTCVAALAAVGVTASIIQRPSLLLERIATTGIPIASLVSKKAEQRSDGNKATFLENAPAAQRSPIAPIQVVAREEPAVSIEAAEPELRSAQRAKLGGAVTDAPVDEASVVPVQPDLPSASVPADELSGSSRPTRQFDPGETSFLLQRSESLIAAGDFASARILYERVAEGGSAQAAFALAATYDPLVLRRFSIKGLAPDIDTARAWYQKAAQLGSSEASRRLELLPSQAQK